MPRGTARNHGSSGEGISHFNSIRMRIIGTGSLLMTLFSMQDVRSEVLVPFTMGLTTNIQPTRLANFIEQRASLQIKTTAINEYFRINRIIIFSKEFATSYPG